MNPQEKQQVDAHDDKWAPFSKRVKISSTNKRLETTMSQKEETFQLVIDLIKNFTCFKAFIIYTDVLKIFMQQFWYSIKKLQGTYYYEFLLANKKYTVNDEVFRQDLRSVKEWKNVDLSDVASCDRYVCYALENQLLSVSLLICLEKHDCVEMIPSGNSLHTTLPPNMVDPLLRLWSEDPNQHLTDFLKLVDSLDLDGENRERMRLRLFQFSLHDQARNWLERLPAGSITTWEDLTTQFSLPGRTAKLRNDILMFQQHHGQSLSEAWTHPEQAFVEYASSHTDEVGGKRRRRLSTNAHEHDLESVVRGKEEAKEQGMVEDEMGTTEEVEELFEDEESEIKTEKEVKEVFDDETEEEEDDDTKYYNSPPAIKELVYHEWMLKNPQPSWVKAKIRAKNPSNTKISCMIGHILKRHAYIDIESLKILWEFVFGNPFIEEIDLVYNKEEGTIIFSMNNKIITFKMPHTMEIFKRTRLMGLSTDSIPSSAYEENFGHERTHYYQSLLIRDEYKHEGDIPDGVKRPDTGKLTNFKLYLMRRSLEVLRKFHGTILGGRFNQLSYVSSPLLSKPGE
uniref:Retrotransposon gag domain-containing protein n=1 Tax=Tanacetum cinerariifolium TaxID=118510 RepID=A0A6L2JJX9_TANCI|nr:hypothetical protein [Tanacetum cinerariifolium]